MTELHPLLNFSFSSESIILSKDPWMEDDFGTRIDRIDVKVFTTWKNSSSCVRVFSRLEFPIFVSPHSSWLASFRNTFDPMNQSVWQHAITAARRLRRRRSHVI